MLEGCQFICTMLMDDIAPLTFSRVDPRSDQSNPVCRRLSHLAKKGQGSNSRDQVPSVKGMGDIYITVQMHKTRCDIIIRLL